MRLKGHHALRSLNTFKVKADHDMCGSITHLLTLQWEASEVGNLKGRIIAALGSFLLLASLAGGVAFAQSSTAKPGAMAGFDQQAQPGNLQNYYLDQLAKNLNVSRSQLDTAMKAAGNSTVDQAVQQGQIPSNQAQGWHDRINQGSGAFIGLPFAMGMGRPPGMPGGPQGPQGQPGQPGQRGPQGPGMGMPPRGQGNQQGLPGFRGWGIDGLIPIIAEQFGMDSGDLWSQLRGGKKLGEIAKEHNIADLNDIKPGLVITLRRNLQQQGVSEERINRVINQIEKVDLNHLGGPPTRRR
jgi:hypothetical protein